MNQVILNGCSIIDILAMVGIFAVMLFVGWAIQTFGKKHL